MTSPGGQTLRGLPGVRGRAPGGQEMSAPSQEDQRGEEWRRDLEGKTHIADLDAEETVTAV